MSSLHVLDLLADTFKQAFCLNRDPSYIRVLYLGGNGVHFPVHFLNKKIQGLARDLIIMNYAAEFIHVAGGSGQLFRNIPFVAQKHDLLCNPVLVSSYS